MVNEEVFKDRLRRYLKSEGIVDIDAELERVPFVTIDLLTPEGVSKYIWES